MKQQHTTTHNKTTYLSPKKGDPFLEIENFAAFLDGTLLNGEFAVIIPVLIHIKANYFKTQKKYKENK